MSRSLAAILADVAATLPEDEAATLLAAVEPAWEARRRRLDARDAAIRQALAVLAHLGPTGAAKAVERAWAAFRRGAPAYGPIAGHVARAAGQHGEAPPLSWPQIARIGREGRTPPCA